MCPEVLTGERKGGPRKDVLAEEKGGMPRVGTVCLAHVGRRPGPHSLAGPASSRAAVVGGEGA